MRVTLEEFAPARIALRSMAGRPKGHPQFPLLFGWMEDRVGVELVGRLKNAEVRNEIE